MEEVTEMQLHRLSCFLTALVLCTGSMLAQEKKVTFEVASVKPAAELTPALIQSGKIHAGIKVDGKRADMGQVNLLALICKAYDVKSYQVKSLPWMTGNAMSIPRYDIVANFPEGATKEQFPEMLQNLLADRFKLVIHKEEKEIPVYVMTEAKGGHKLKPIAAPTGADAPNPAVSGSSSVSIEQKGSGATLSDGAGRSQKMTMNPDGKSMHFDASGLTVSEFAEGMAPLVDRPIVDQTAIKGQYQMEFDISMEEIMAIARKQGMLPAGADAPPSNEASDPSGSSLFKTLQGLGFKLEPKKIPMTMIVVDSAEKNPTGN
jgi:uncharacterized protein (TIGR03435 family)